jgi:O-acetylhomoserine/O-acetylserine sulfhydrylase-like pyridoxal-dependent enzyme
MITKTKAVYAGLGSPLINVLDLQTVADLAHEAGIPLIVDNTFASPYLRRRVRRHIVVHSAQVHRRARHHHGRVMVESENFLGTTATSPV